MKKIIQIILLLLILFSVFGIYTIYQERYIPPDIVLSTKEWYDYSGVIHIHTKYSDGGGTINEITEAARKLGLQFILIADHNTLQPFLDGVEGWNSGILVLAGIEISSSVGHLLYYDAGSLFKNYDPDKVEKLLQSNPGLDTLLVIAHPFHPRMSFNHWVFPGYGGIELFNGDVQWRDNSLSGILLALFGSLWFPDASNHLINYPVRSVDQWNKLLNSRFVAGIGSADAHSNLKITKNFHLNFPSYSTAFRYVRTHIITKTPFTGDLAIDRTSVIRAIRQGHTYIELGNFCDPKGFMFTVQQDSFITLPGDTYSLKETVKLFIQSPDTTNIFIRLFKDGVLLQEVWNKKMLIYNAELPGVYRAEVFQVRDAVPLFSPGSFPWIISNPIFIVK